MELLIVTYHYIEPEDKYTKGIYPVSPERFKRQLDTLQKKYTFVSEKELVDAIKKKNKLPEKACLITFDDGLHSQYENAVPTLREKGIPAIFFVTTRPYQEKKAAIVHKIHYLLAQVPEDVLLSELKNAYEEIEKKKFNLSLLEDVKKIRKWYIYDTEKTAIFKYLLNHTFSQELSSKIIETLFKKPAIINLDEASFCDDIYMKKEDMESLYKDKLFSVGLHSHSHMDISQFSIGEVIKDFQKNLSILNNYFSIKNISGLSYPYGITDKDGEEDKIHKVAEKLNLSYGVTTKKGINLNLNDPFLLKRFNPNDIQNL
tara:strand:+ start:9489 stop:10436 length:948 start_codon:yes stop_codon:yes gene_type:complete